VHRLVYPPSPDRAADGRHSGSGADAFLPFSPVLLALAVLATVLLGAFALRFVAGRERSSA
jgi:hypothetical protein